MVEFIHKTLGTHMWVAEKRVEEYKAAGHIPAADLNAEKPVEAKPKRSRATKK